jgi:hypothetical protein
MLPGNMPESPIRPDRLREPASVGILDEEPRRTREAASHAALDRLRKATAEVWRRRIRLSQKVRAALAPGA